MLRISGCKINIGLHITEKRPDGYHNLESCFYPVRWGDVVEAIPAPEMQFTTSGLAIPGHSATNLCVRAYQLLQADHNLPPVHLHLHKLVPIGAGLGGGSADAAFTIKLLNELFGLGLPDDQLEDYARRLGSDCAFFIRNRPRYGTEKGDTFVDTDVDLTGYYVLLVYPNVAISTAEAYAGVQPQRPAQPLHEWLKQPIATWRATVQNDFEKSLFPRYPALAQIKQQLYDAGAMYASLSGSGSTLYGIFEAPVAVPNHFDHYVVWQTEL